MPIGYELLEQSGDFRRHWLKRVGAGLIDGLIVAQTTGDPVLKALGLKNIKRQLWNEYEEAFSIKKGTVGGEVDKMLSDGVAKLKASGELDKMTADMAKASKYQEWQP